MISELKAAFSKLERDKNVKVIVLRAEGKVFSAGADLQFLEDLQKFSYEDNLADSTHLKELLLQIYTLEKIVIAEVQGHAIAGGCGLVSVCDFVYSTAEASFGYTEVKIGFIPAIVLVFLLRKIGEARVKQLVLSGDLISATDACELGLVSKVVPAMSLSEDVIAFAKKLSVSNSGEAMKVTKRMIAEVQSMSLNDALSFAAEMNARARSSDDCKRGVAAFLRKDKISW